MILGVDLIHDLILKEITFFRTRYISQLAIWLAAICLLHSLNIFLKKHRVFIHRKKNSTWKILI